MRGDAFPWSISLLMDLSSPADIRTEWDDLWFPMSIIASKYDFCISFFIGSRW